MSDLKKSQSKKNQHRQAQTAEVTDGIKQFTGFEAIAIVDDQQQRSAELANTTGLEFGNATTHDFTLQWVDDKLNLRNHKNKRPVDTCIDFTSGRLLHRLKFGGGHGQPLARAVKTSSNPVICDATAGFGKDAFVFASLGCRVVLIEQSVVVHALLHDALQRALAHTEIKPIAQRMQLYRGNSSTLPEIWASMQPEQELPQVVYLDPMYPPGKRTAKKDIQALRELLEPQQDELTLLTAARKTAGRVVVKRPRNAPPLAQCTPSGKITSPNTRYDIYGAVDNSGG